MSGFAWHINLLRAYRNYSDRPISSKQWSSKLMKCAQDIPLRDIYSVQRIEFKSPSKTLNSTLFREVERFFINFD